MTQLSTHFTLEEAITSETADRKGIINRPPPQIITAMAEIAVKMETVRLILGKPIHVNSWYRCLELNKVLGSGPKSQHPLGEAVDFICPQFGSPIQVIKKLISEKSLVCWDQLIFEHSWIHISWKSGNLPTSAQRGQVLSLLANGHYAQGLTSPSGQPII